MKKQSLKALAILLGASLGFAGCNGLSKMVKNAGKVSYTVTPKPLTEKGDSVDVSISGNYPAKFFAKKVTLTVTPTLKYSNGKTLALKPVTLVGEKATGNGTKISYDKGGSFNYTDKVAYQPDMKMDELDIDATGAVKSTKKDFPPLKVADGTIATSLLVKSDDKLVMAKDNFKKVIPESITTHIYYVINRSEVRRAQMRSDEMKDFEKFINTGIAQGYTFQNIGISAYASPDGEVEMNAHLAGDRAKTATQAMEKLCKKLKMDEGTKADFYKKQTTGEDWAGFKKLMEASSIKDKDLILRVLTMYKDHDKRMKEIKNLSKTYVVIADKILPKLRRAVITLNAEKKSRSDAQIMQLVKSHPDSLSVEELLYAATLTNDMNAKLNIYKTAEKQYSNDWRCANNVGYIETMQNKLSDAQGEFEKAAKLSPNNPIVENNMGVVARRNGDRKTAMADFKKAGSPEATYNMGIVDIQNGNYADAVANFGTNNTFNAALAKLLNGDASGAMTVIDASAEKDDALSDYLKAIIGAHLGKTDVMLNSLKAAINKDASYKAMAKSDCEFLKYRTSGDFKAAVQ